MSADFSKNIYHGYILKGDLIGAIDYAKQFPEQEALYNRYQEVFEQEKYITYDVDTDLNGLLTLYQRYYRDVFYLCIGKENAANQLRVRLAESLGIHDESMELDDMEQNRVAETFQGRDFYFLGGKTSGYYGPYIWRTMETKTYEVELPDGIQPYTIKLLDGFIARSWTDYLTFGEIGTGGWTDKEGIIHCVKSVYDFESEDFKVSLLKHEAQHARDLKSNPDMSVEELEYRAKLAELIYSSERNLLGQFIQEADSKEQSNGHAFASDRILDGYIKKLNISRTEVERLPINQVQTIARKLYEEATMPEKQFKNY